MKRDLLRKGVTLSDKLRAFIESEIQAQRTNPTAFAKNADIGVQTLSDYLNGKISYPTIPTLIKLAKVTRTNVTQLFRLAIADDVDDADVSAEDLILARRLNKLPKASRDVIDKLIFGQTLSQSD